MELQASSRINSRDEALAKLNDLLGYDARTLEFPIFGEVILYALLKIYTKDDFKNLMNNTVRFISKEPEFERNGILYKPSDIKLEEVAEMPSTSSRCYFNGIFMVNLTLKSIIDSGKSSYTLASDNIFRDLQLGFLPSDDFENYEYLDTPLSELAGLNERTYELNKFFQ
jgi:hypothetical protein